MSETFDCGHPHTPDNTYTVRGKYHYCRTCRNVRAAQQRREAGPWLSTSQVALLRRVASGLSVGDPGEPEGPFRSIVRRGFIFRTGGRYELTEAGERALAAAQAQPVGAR